MNLSASQFSHQSELFPKILDNTGLNPRNLQLELTERVVMDDAEFVLAELQRLKDLGVSLAIDDFGMGYSYLYYLKRMPVGSLKIGRSFIAGLEKNVEDEAIVSGTISLAHALGLKVVAEGVETTHQLAKLQELGCDLLQGFHLAKPLPGGAIPELLTEDHRW